MPRGIRIIAAAHGEHALAPKTHSKPRPVTYPRWYCCPRPAGRSEVGMATTAWAGVAVAIPICLAASPYVARLTLTVPDRGNATWYRGVAVSRRRQVVTAGIALVLGALAGAAAGLSALLPAFIVLALTGTPLIVIDYEQHRLPNRLVYPMAASVVVLLFAAAASRDDWSDLLRAGEGGVA